MKNRHLEIDDVRDDMSSTRLRPIQALYWAVALLYIKWSIRCGTGFLTSEKVVGALTVGLFFYSFFILQYNHKYETRKGPKAFTYGAVAAYLCGAVYFVFIAR